MIPTTRSGEPLPADTSTKPARRILSEPTSPVADDLMHSLTAHAASPFYS